MARSQACPTRRSCALLSCALVAGIGAGLHGAAAAEAPQAVQGGLSLKRTSLTSGTATGHPNGGTFSYQTANPTGGTIGQIGSSDATSNPNMISLPDPANPNANGRPAQGGFGKYTVTYNVNGMAILNKQDDPFQIPTFGMSCYDLALESDWGQVGPKTCKSLKLSGTTYSGTVKDPYGYSGTFCKSFIAEVKLQGSGQTNAGNFIQYDAGAIKQVTEVKGADGTPVIADQTVARSRAVIPGRGVHINLDNVATGLLANDTGGAIVNYRIDYYRGFGNAACAGFVNIMSIAACGPSQPKCSSYAFPTGD